MATEIRLPSLSEGGKTGTIINILVSPGDTIAVDQGIVEVETEKAVVEVPADVGGVVAAVHVKDGDEAAEGMLLVTVDEAGGGGAADTAEADGVAADGNAAGGAVAAPPSTAAGPAPVAAESAAPVQAAPAAVATAPASAGTAGRAPAGAAAAPAAAPAGNPGTANGALIPAAPSTRRFARELGIDLSRVSGSGPAGRISVDDVKAFVRERSAAGNGMAPGVAAPGALPAGVALPDFSRWGYVEREKMSGVRRATAIHLAQGWASVPQVTQYDEADATGVEQFRRRYGKRVEAGGGKLTVTAILLKIAARALDVFPQFASSVDMANEELIRKHYRHIGVAVDTDRGLLVPVLRDVDQKGLAELSAELSQVAQRARDRKLTPDEMQGGVFTISNLGGIGGVGFSPIVNAPEVAILGVSRGQLRPVYANGPEQPPEPRTMLPLSLSYDHRVIDGADAARFLRWICEALEQPLSMEL